MHKRCVKQKLATKDEKTHDNVSLENDKKDVLDIGTYL